MNFKSITMYSSLTSTLVILSSVKRTGIKPTCEQLRVPQRFYRLGER